MPATDATKEAQIGTEALSQGKGGPCERTVAAFASTKAGAGQKKRAHRGGRGSRQIPRAQNKKEPPERITTAQSLARSTHLERRPRQKSKMFPRKGGKKQELRRTHENAFGASRGECRATCAARVAAKTNIKRGGRGKQVRVIPPAVRGKPPKERDYHKTGKPHFLQEKKREGPSYKDKEHRVEAREGLRGDRRGEGSSVEQSKHTHRRAQEKDFSGSPHCGLERGRKNVSALSGTLLSSVRRKKWGPGGQKNIFTCQGAFPL